MLEGYVVGRPASRNRGFKGYNLLLFSEYGAMTVYAHSENSGQLFKKVFYNSWLKAFNYYYNTLELEINKVVQNDKQTI